MNIRTTVSSPARRSRHPILFIVLPTGLTLAAVLLAGVWMLRGGADGPGAAPAVEQQTAAMPQQVATGTEKGGLAELQDDRGQARPAPAPYVVYLVDTAESRDAFSQLGLTEGESVLVAGTPDEQAAAQAHIALLEMNIGMGPDARAVRVVDLRGQVTGVPTTGLGEPSTAAAIVPTRVTVYLVGNAAEAEGLQGLVDGLAGALEPSVEYVVLSADLDERVQTQQIIRNLRLEFGDEQVRVVDLRRSPVTHATDSAVLLDPDEEWANLLREAETDAQREATARAAGPTTVGSPVRSEAVSDQEMFSQWQAVQQAAGDDAGGPRPTAVIQTVYLVASTEEADAVQWAIDEANAIRATFGEPPRAAVVLVIAAEEEDRILRALGDSDAIRDSLGLSGLVVVDLRAPA